METGRREKSGQSAVFIIITAAIAAIWVAVDCLVGPAALFFIQDFGFFLIPQKYTLSVADSLLFVAPALDLLFFAVIMFLPKKWPFRFAVAATAGLPLLLLAACDGLVLYRVATFFNQ